MLESVRHGCILSPRLMINISRDEPYRHFIGGSGKKINNLRFARDTTLVSKHEMTAISNYSPMKPELLGSKLIYSLHQMKLIVIDKITKTQLINLKSSLYSGSPIIYKGGYKAKLRRLIVLDRTSWGRSTTSNTAVKYGIRRKRSLWRLLNRLCTGIFK